MTVSTSQGNEHGESKERSVFCATLFVAGALLACGSFGYMLFILAGTVNAIVSGYGP